MTGRDYYKKQYGIWLPIIFMDEFKRYVSIKWPEHPHGALSLEIQLAMTAWMEKGTHTQKDTAFMAAQSKPNWHTRKKGVVRETSAPAPAPVPEPVLNAIVLSNLGNSSGQYDFSLSELAKSWGIEVTDKHRELARRTLTDPAFRIEKFTEYKNRLKAMKNRSTKGNVDSKVSKRKEDNHEKMREIILYLDNENLLSKESKVSKDDFKSAVSVVYGVNDHRPINAIIRNLTSDGEIDEARLGSIIHGNPSGKRSDWTHYQIIDRDKYF
jgi:hypothetical protein